MQSSLQFDVLIVGSGAAGLTLALRLPTHLHIAVLAKGPLNEGSTLYAQGGISAVLDDGDSIDAHVQDTLAAGAGLCDPDIVRYTAERGPECIRWLIDKGVAFTTINSKPEQEPVYHLTREGGHSHRRIVHAADSTGHAVQTTLAQQAKAATNVHLFEHHIAVDLIQHTSTDQPLCHGAYVLDANSNKVNTFLANTTVLATGGANKVYLYSTNPESSTGDGIAIAWRAGCRIANMEFMQFHPTCLYHPHDRSFLISEAVRGEGGLLKLPNGERFMPAFHELAELAPRDVVARAIDHEMKRLGIDNVFLDISHKSPEFIKQHFPGISSRCAELGLDMTTQPLPVVPAAHYTCGGVLVDRHGQTSLNGLYSIGETACTGLHGANRMASNSLLECLVFASSAAEHIAAHQPAQNQLQAPDWDASQVTTSDDEVVISHDWHELRQVMWDYVGIVRSNKRLELASKRLEWLHAEIDEYYRRFHINSDVLELRNLVVVAQLIVSCAKQRKESRGLHYTKDYPQLASGDAQNTILQPRQ